MSAPSVTFSSVSFAWPDGTALLDGLDLVVPTGTSGLVGVNGVGKSTLLRLVAGDLRPTSGHVVVNGQVGYLSQDLTLRTDLRATEFLGIAHVLAAIRAIEAGEVVADQLDVVDAYTYPSHVGEDDRSVGRHADRLAAGAPSPSWQSKAWL